MLSPEDTMIIMKIIAVATMCICICICACYWHFSQKREAGTPAKKADDLMLVNMSEVVQDREVYRKNEIELRGMNDHVNEQLRHQTDRNEALEVQSEVLQNEIAVLLTELRDLKHRLQESQANCATLLRTHEIHYAN
tara:strand:+ start:69 stop:479 length:411 start_codon:yes stop_codon:yes gene_type:complete